MKASTHLSKTFQVRRPKLNWENHARGEQGVTIVTSRSGSLDFTVQGGLQQKGDC